MPKRTKKQIKEAKRVRDKRRKETRKRINDSRLFSWHIESGVEYSPGYDTYTDIRWVYFYIPASEFALLKRAAPVIKAIDWDAIRDL